MRLQDPLSGIKMSLLNPYVLVAQIITFLFLIATDYDTTSKFAELAWILFGVSCFCFLMVILASFVIRPLKKLALAKWCDLLSYCVLLFTWIYGTHQVFYLKQKSGITL